MAEGRAYRKGQLVAVRKREDEPWELRVSAWFQRFESEPGRRFRFWACPVEGPRRSWAEEFFFAEPAERVWPELAAE